MANTAFEHSPTITVPGSGNSTDNAVVLWNGTTGNNFSNSLVIITSGAVTGVTSLVVDDITINGTSITTTASDNNINITPNGTGSVVISKVDINGGDITGVTISGGLTWSANQDLNNVNLTNVDIDSGTIDGATIGASSASTVVATTIQLTSGSPSDGKVLTATDNSGNTAWETAGGGAISSTSGGAATYIPRYSGTTTLVGSSNLKFATDDGSYLTIDGGSGSGDGADVFLRIPANSVANPTLRWYEGTADGSTGNMRYQIGYEANGNKFSMYSRATAGVSGSAGTGGNIMEIADGTGQFTFPFGVSGVNSTNSGVNFVGLQNGVSMTDNQIMSITIADSAFVLVRNITTGRGALFFAEYGSTMVEISDPGNLFEPSETDNGKINVYKGANAGVMYVMNRSNGTKTISVLILGHVSAATMPA